MCNLWNRIRRAAANYIVVLKEKIIPDTIYKPEILIMGTLEDRVFRVLLRRDKWEKEWVPEWLLLNWWCCKSKTCLLNPIFNSCFQTNRKIEDYGFPKDCIWLLQQVMLVKLCNALSALMSASISVLCHVSMYNSVVNGDELCADRQCLQKIFITI